MFRSSDRFWFWCMLLSASVLAAHAETIRGSGEKSLFIQHPTTHKGDFGSDLSMLRSFYSPPHDPNIGNHVFDMWEKQTLLGLLKHAGLTNNRALIVNSHAKGLSTRYGLRQAYYPHKKFTADPPAYFSAADIAHVLGRARLARIHNIVLAGCNRDGAIDAVELRRLFFSATNIVYVPAGEIGYQPMFLQIFLSDSAHIQPIYEIARRRLPGRSEFEIIVAPEPGATRLSPYVAALFEPGSYQPFRIQQAGRELLEPYANVSESTFSSLGLEPDGASQ